MDLKEIQKKTEDFVKNLVNNAKDEKQEVENEDVDKRKLIDEVAGIMKSAGCDDEDIRTAIGKMEKIGYDKSEAGKADNKKVKNEDEEDKDKVKDLEKDVEKDVENKCGNKAVKNSKHDFYEEINKIYNSSVQAKEESVYVSRADKLKAGEEMFKVN